MAASTSSRFPDWFMLDRFVFGNPLPDDDPLAATSTNSIENKFSIGFKLADPPRPSCLHLQAEDAGLVNNHQFEVVAAHRDALLFQMLLPDEFGRVSRTLIVDYFLYRTTGGAGGSPSLELLPPLGGGLADQLRSRQQNVDRLLRRWTCKGIGLLSRGEEGFAVAELVTISSSENPVLNVLRCTSRSSPLPLLWEVKHPLPVAPLCLNTDSDDNDDMSDFSPHESWCLDFFLADTVVPLGDNYLCWVDYRQGVVLICDVFADSPELRYRRLPPPLQLPNLPPPIYPGTRLRFEFYHAMGVTKGGVMKYVRVDVTNAKTESKIFPTHFTVTSWTLHTTDQSSSSKLMESWEWKLDPVLTSDELSPHLESLTQLKCAPLHYPLVSMDDPDVIYFVLGTNRVQKQKEEWIVGIDMTNKSLRSSFLYMNPERAQDPSLSRDEARYYGQGKSGHLVLFLPAEFAKHLCMMLVTRTDLLQPEKKMKLM